MSEFNKLLPNICDNMAKTASYAINYADDDTQEEILNTLRNSMQKCVESSLKLENINKLATKYSSVASEVEKFNAGVASFQPDASGHELLRQFDKRVSDLKKNLTGSKGNEGDDEEDLQVTEDDSSNLICPISKVRMTEPMINDICGHVYDKSSIVALLKNSTGTRCPIVGCSNKKHLIMNDLKPDIVRQMCMNQDLD